MSVAKKDYKRITTKTLIEMRQQCKILAKRERNQSCFHITVVTCKPTFEFGK